MTAASDSRTLEEWPAGVPAPLLELGEMERDHYTNRSSFVDTLVDDAWRRIPPTDLRWQTVYAVLVSNLEGSESDQVFASAYNAAQQLIIVLSDMHSEHADGEVGASWRNVHRLDALHAEFGVIIGHLKDAMLEVSA